MKKQWSWWVLVLSAGLFTVTHFIWINQMPDRLATHFDAVGRPNGWMSRSSHGGLMISTALGVPGLIVLLSFLIHRLPPAVVNLPNASYWRRPENFPQACAVMRNWSLWLASGTILWMTFLNYQLVRANLSSPPRLDAGGTWVLGGMMVIIVGASLFWMWKQFRLPLGRTISRD